MSLDMNNDNYLTKTLLCKNNCGYYGNSIQYDGYCSICYRKLKSRNNKSHRNNQSGLFDSDNAGISSSQSFNQFSFDEKG